MYANDQSLIFNKKKWNNIPNYKIKKIKHIGIV